MTLPSLLTHRPPSLPLFTPVILFSASVINILHLLPHSLSRLSPSLPLTLSPLSPISSLLLPSSSNALFFFLLLYSTILAPVISFDKTAV